MKFKEKMVSIIIPVYQAKNSLMHCVESVLNQTYDNKEIILVDDGANDGSEGICDDYAVRYNHVCCIHQKNKGASAARNSGLDKAQGQYILFVDSDDYIEEGYLEDAVSAFQQEDIDMYLCGYQKVWEKDRVQYKEYYPVLKEGEHLAADIGNRFWPLFQSCVLHAIGTKIYKRELIKKHGIRFKKNWNYYEDIYFCLNYLCHCNKIYVKKGIMYSYRIDTDNSLSKRENNRKYKSIYKTYCLLIQLMGQDAISEKEKTLLYKTYLYNINTLLTAKISIEKHYNKNINKLYKELSKDSLYFEALKYAGGLSKIEYLCITHKLYFLAYFINKRHEET